MEIIICILISIVAGIFFGRYMFRKETLGSLRVDQSDPDSGPYLFLEIPRDSLNKLYKKKYVVLKVKIKNYISHK